MTASVLKQDPNTLFFLKKKKKREKRRKKKRKKDIDTQSANIYVYLITNKRSFESFMCLDLDEDTAVSATILHPTVCTTETHGRGWNAWKRYQLTTSRATLFLVFFGEERTNMAAILKS